MASSTATDLTSFRSGYTDPDTVIVPKDEYDQLVRISHQYASLRENLIRGGVTDETVDLLSNIVAANQPQTQTAQAPGPAFERRAPSLRPQARKDPLTGQWVIPQDPSVANWTETEDFYEEEDEDESRGTHTPPFFTGGGPENEPDFTGRNEAKQRQYARHADRSITLSDLPEGTTHADITAVVRGGQLLDVFLRYKEQSVSVSFLHEEDAYAFFENVRKYGLYIKNQMVNISWSDRQYTLPDHLSRKITHGATRNIVIRRCKHDTTEESIRDDLEHIHNLIVVKVEIIGNNCFISTNSVSCATFARTCMMSRLKYKGGCRIEFDLDECAQVFVPPSKKPMMEYAHKSTQKPVQKRVAAAPFAKTSASAANAMANRFNLLDMDD